MENSRYSLWMAEKKWSIPILELTILNAKAHARHYYLSLLIAVACSACKMLFFVAKSLP
jgi:hypothetical protein